LPLFQIRFAAFTFEQTATFFRNGFECACAVQPGRSKTIPRGERVGIVGEQKGSEKLSDLFINHGVAPNRMNGSEFEAIVRISIFGHNSPGESVSVMRSFSLWHCCDLVTAGSVADIRNATLEQRIHQCGFANVGNAHDHHAQRLVCIVAMGGKRLTQFGNLGGVTAILQLSATALTPVFLL